VATGFVPAKSEISREILKCGKDPEYFINTYIKVEHPVKGVLPFSLYPFQKETLKKFAAFRFNIVLKARQLGISTLMAAYIVWLIMFRRDRNVLVVATKFSVAGKLVRKVRKMIQRLPPWLCISSVITDNRQSIELDNGSIVNASTTAGDVVGGAFSYAFHRWQLYSSFNA
jgi:phage terminase large subunit-like protein